MISFFGILLKLYHTVAKIDYVCRQNNSLGPGFVASRWTGVSANPLGRSLYRVAERPLMGSSLTSGGSLRRNTPCFVCHTCTTMRSWQSIHCHDNTSILMSCAPCLALQTRLLRLKNTKYFFFEFRKSL